MEYRTIYLNQYSSKIELTRFAAADVQEAHAILHVDANGELFESQLRRLQLSLQTFMQEREMEGHKMVFMRYFLSDATNQAPLIEQTGGCTVSFIQQPPLDGSKVLFSLLPDSAYAWLMRYERYGMILLYILLFADVLDTPLNFLRTGLLNGLSSAVSFLIGLFV